MKIVSNNKLIHRNKMISQGVLYLSLAMLLLGFLWSFTNPDAAQTVYAYLILIPAYLLVQVSIYMAKRWGRSPRPDEIIERSLKGLNNQYTLYNYTTPVPHMLFGPAGIWIINPYSHSGEITFNPNKNRYEQKGGPNIISKLFAQESLPDIENDNRLLKSKMEKYLGQLELKEMPEYYLANVFYSDKAEVHARNAPEITIHAEKLKDLIRTQAKTLNLKDEFLNPIRDQMPQSENSN